MKLYIVSMTKRMYDYGTLLDTEKGVCLMAEDRPGTYYIVRGTFESGVSVETFKARFQKALGEHPNADVELVVLDPVSTSFDMNPHGLI